MLSQAWGEGDGGYMCKSSLRTVFSEISFSVHWQEPIKCHWPYPDGTSKIWNHRQTTLCSCCRRNSNEYLQTKTRIWTKSHYGYCLTSKCVNKSLSEMVTLSFAVFFFRSVPSSWSGTWSSDPAFPPPPGGIRIWKGWRCWSEILNSRGGGGGG